MANDSFLSDFIAFKKFLSRTLILIVYALGFVFITIKGFSTMFEKQESFFGMRSDISGQILLGLAILIFGNLLWRIICEGAIILFSIHDELTSIRIELQNK